MAVPKRKPSRARRGMRRTHQGLSQPSFAICPQCKEVRLPHHICQNCGYYNGKEVIKEKPKTEEEAK